MRISGLLFTVCLLGVVSFEVTAGKLSAPIIIDHRCTNLASVPEKDIKQAKKNFKIAYGHTSHGSQIVSGMQALARANKLFSYNRDGSNGALSFWDRTPGGDLGNPNRTEWASRTRKLLEGRGRDRNLIMWSWCGQAGSASERDIDTYLELMSDLEKKFPEVTFVYMTGHLNGSGKNGNLNRRNEQIRAYCRKNNKVLFDFADIESFDPDGKVNYMELNARDNCDYRKGGRKYNWAEDWIQKNPSHGLALPGSAAHTHRLNGALKGQAFWWMMARLAGWTPPANSGQRVEAINPVKYLKKVQKQSGKDTSSNSSGEAEFSKVYRFNKISDYRDWNSYGTKGQSIIPENGTGLDIPRGGDPGLAVYRVPLRVSELEFKAQVINGNHVNWYIATDLDGSWKPRKGIGGIIRGDGCMLTLDGKVVKLTNSPKIDDKEHHYQVNIKDGTLIWGMDGKVIAERKLPELTARTGSVAIGAWDSNIRINGVFIKGSE